MTLVNAANFVINTDDGRGDVDAQKHFAHALIEVRFVVHHSPRSGPTLLNQKYVSDSSTKQTYCIRVWSGHAQ